MANVVDRVVSFFSATAGAERARARLREKTFEQIGKRHFEGASRGSRTSGWLTTGKGANAELLPSLAILRNRSRDLERNNPYALSGIESIVGETIGTGIVATFKNAKGPSLEKRWKDWAETTACDADGMHNFAGLQELAFRTIVTSGEVIVRRRRRRLEDGLPVPLQIQVLEPDFLDSQKNENLESGGWITQGVEFNPFGQRVAYWLFSEHPGEAGARGRISVVSKRYDASEIKHVFRATRAGQVRGYPWLAPIIIRLRDFDEYEDAQLVRQKVAACFAAFIEDIEASGDAETAKAQFGADRLEPGTITRLPQGTRINSPPVPGVADDGHSSRVLHSVSAGMGTTYESLTGDYSNVNYSSARMANLRFGVGIEKWRWNLFIPGACDTVGAWFLEAALLMNEKVDGVKIEWTPPARPMIDMGKEIEANKTAIRSGQKSLSGVLREQGLDPKAHLEEIARDAKMLDDLGLKLDCDPRSDAPTPAAPAATQKKKESTE
jgi:lambda family phage portal protein